MKPELTKGNEAIVKAAILAGCRAYYGYPITPASEIAEAAAEVRRQWPNIEFSASAALSMISKRRCGIGCILLV